MSATKSCLGKNNYMNKPIDRVNNAHGKIVAWNPDCKNGFVWVDQVKVYVTHGQIKTHLSGDLTGYWLEFPRTSVVDNKKPSASGVVGKRIRDDTAGGTPKPTIRLVTSKAEIATLDASYIPPSVTILPPRKLSRAN